jgi:hypothetical protein
MSKPLPLRVLRDSWPKHTYDDPNHFLSGNFDKNFALSKT